MGRASPPPTLMSVAERTGVPNRTGATDVAVGGTVSRSEEALDADGDGLGSANETNPPPIPDALANDADGDGIVTRHEALDLNWDGKVTRSEKALDADGDGTFSAAETTPPHISGAQATDTDGDGVITRHEALDLNRDGKVSWVEKERLDANADGSVSTLETLLPYIPGARSSDTDGDGKVSKHEVLDLNRDGRVSSVEKTRADADRDGAVSPSELLSTLASPKDGHGAEDAALAEILGRHGVSAALYGALGDDLLRWKAGLTPIGGQAAAVASTNASGSLSATHVVLGLWATPADAVDELVLCAVALTTLVSIVRWVVRRCCRRHYAQVQTARPSSKQLVVTLHPSSEQLDGTPSSYQ